jgi:hypothetical protein
VRPRSANKNSASSSGERIEPADFRRQTQTLNKGFVRTQVPDDDARETTRSSFNPVRSYSGATPRNGPVTVLSRNEVNPTFAPARSTRRKFPLREARATQRDSRERRVERVAKGRPCSVMPSQDPSVVRRYRRRCVANALLQRRLRNSHGALCRNAGHFSNQNWPPCAQVLRCEALEKSCGVDRATHDSTRNAAKSALDIVVPREGTPSRSPRPLWEPCSWFLPWRKETANAAATG